ncbi:MAG: hypothetical protein PHU92_03510 [Candidatus Shapirobacteria bacterium]|nr:hypothetical protein [Candidatus Shapirobacteria bacterium]
MFARRIVKQAYYGVGVLLIIVTAVAVLLAIVIAPLIPDSPEPTPASSYQSIIIEHVESLRHGDTVDVIAKVKNPNPYAGVESYPLSIEIVNDLGKVISQQTETSYILPGSTQYIAKLAIPVSGPIAEVRVTPPMDPQFTSLAKNVVLPSFSYFVRDPVIRNVGTVQVEERKGNVTNNSTLGFERVEVTLVGLDKSERVVSAGKTFIGRLDAGEQREFTVQWPLSGTPIERVVVLPTTNIFQDSNIIRIIGDPASLQ